MGYTRTSARGDWLAADYTASQGATHGASFCDVESTSANCYFKAINGAVPDQFTLRRGNGQNPTSAQSSISTAVDAFTETLPLSAPESATSMGGYVFSRTDKSELRWISTAANGSLGSVWIDATCVSQLGVIQARGDWKALIAIAPEG